MDHRSKKPEYVKQPDVSGLILAGGRSTRFGADKASFVVQGRPMIARVHDALRRVTDDVLISVGARTGFPLLPGRYVTDHFPGAGPLAGLHAALAAGGRPWLLVVACDMPFITAGVLQMLVQARKADHACVVGQTPDGKLQPLCGCYHASVFPVVEEKLGSGARAMHALLEAIPYVTVALPALPLLNVNTPSDLAAHRREP